MEESLPIFILEPGSLAGQSSQDGFMRRSRVVDHDPFAIMYEL